MNTTPWEMAGEAITGPPVLKRHCTPLNAVGPGESNTPVRAFVPWKVVCDSAACANRMATISDAWRNQFSFCVRVADHAPSARPSTRIRPLPESPSIQPARNALTGPGAPSGLPAGHSPANDRSTYPLRQMPLTGRLCPSGPDQVPLTWEPSVCSCIDASMGPASLAKCSIQEPVAADPLASFCAVAGSMRTLEKYAS